jgi:hypothetical protein
VEVRPNWVREGNDAYMVAEWRSSSVRELDVWVWLKDATGTKTLYPLDPPAIDYRHMDTDSKGFNRREKIEIALEPGRRYSVCMYVLPYNANQMGPEITNPEVDGLMTTFLYR